MQRNFTAPAPDRVWLTDITEHRTDQGKLYACVIKDVCSNRIVGHATSDRMTAALATSALRSAVARRQPKGTVVVHSDRGGQFRSRAFRAVLKANQLAGSMGRVSSAGDNAAMESFYSLLQKNVLDRKRWRTRDDLAYEIVYWIEHTYNHRRRQRGLGQAHARRVRTGVHRKNRRGCCLINENRCQPDRQQTLLSARCKGSGGSVRAM